MRRPSLSTMMGMIPGSGSVASPGLVGVAGATGVMQIPPVSVCHHVSTMVQRFSPTTSKYHFHASGLMGSPTVPSTRSVERSCFFTGSSPCAASARIAVGAV